MPVEKGKLKPADYWAIQKNIRFLKEEVDAQDVVDGLFQEDVFTADDVEEVKSRPSKGQRTELMLQKLLKSGPGRAYGVFLEELRDYPHVVEKLNESSSESEVETDSSWAWFDELSEEAKSQKISDAYASRIAYKIGAGWEAVFLRLGVTQVKISQEKAGSSSDVMAVITRLLISWRQSKGRSATLQCLVNALKEVPDCEVDMDGFREIISTLDKFL